MKDIHFVSKGIGKPIVFIHGFPLSHKIWDEQINLLSTKGFNVIAIDLPGFGESKLEKEISSLDFYSDVIVDLLESLKIEKAIFAGMSMGGYILLNIAKRYSEKINALILIATKSDSDDEIGKQRRTNLIKLCLEKGKEQVVNEFEKILWAEETWQNNPLLISQIRKEMLKATDLGIISGLTAMRERENYSELLPKINFPTLIIHSRLDKAIPIDFAKKMHQLIKNSQLKIFSRGAHMINIEEPQLVNDSILEFIKNI